MNTLKILATCEDNKVNYLLKHGFPKDELWLTDIETVDEAIELYGDIIIDLMNGSKDLYCLYYHESGNILAFASFSNQEDFEEACKQVANYFRC